MKLAWQPDSISRHDSNKVTEERMPAANFSLSDTVDTFIFSKHIEQHLIRIWPVANRDVEMVPSAVSVVILHIGSAVVRVAHAEGPGDVVVGVRGMVVGVNMRLMGMGGGVMVRMVTQRTGEKHGQNLQMIKYNMICQHTYIDLQLRELSAT